MVCAIAACMPSGGSRNGATPSPSRYIRPTASRARTKGTRGTGRATRVASGDLHHDLGRQPGQELGQRLVDVSAIARLEGHLHLVLGVGELRIGAQLQQRKGGQQPVEVV